jgi:hypothetical protein
MPLTNLTAHIGSRTSLVAPVAHHGSSASDGVAEVTLARSTHLAPTPPSSARARLMLLRSDVSMTCASSSLFPLPFGETRAAAAASSGSGQGDGYVGFGGWPPVSPKCGGNMGGIEAFSS